MAMRGVIAVGCAVGAALGDGIHRPPQCKTFKEIYGTRGQGGKEVCENMWDGAFEYTPDDKPAYQMDWYQRHNPNDQTTLDIMAEPENQHNERFFGVDPDTGYTDRCLDYFHKDKPSPEKNMTECALWQDRSCCKKETVISADKLNEGYGEKYHWDRCGQLSPQCWAYFVHEACFYECEPAVELFRMFPKHEDAANHSNYFHKPEHDDNGYKSWQVSKMPIKASFCDRWYEACKNDYFCAADGGSYFSCAAEYEKYDQNLNKAAETPTNDDDLSAKWIGLIVALSVVAVLALVFGGYLVTREKAGKPVFNYTPVDKVGQENQPAAPKPEEMMKQEN